ncbi:MAG: DUF4166 domain-containing protein [Pyrinomonadaceae bacterium]
MGVETVQTFAAGAGLYERLVREAWGGLDEPVRSFHARALSTGTFKVRRGGGRFARLVARLLGLPEAGEAVPLRLTVTPHGGGERWHRAFAGKDFITEQREHAGSLLAERTGPFELLFRLDAEGGALAYSQVGAFLRVRSLRVRLPRRVAPRVEACERAEGRGVRVSVRVSSPLVGRLIEYEGRVTWEEEETG